MHAIDKIAIAIKEALTYNFSQQLHLKYNVLKKQKGTQMPVVYVPKFDKSVVCWK